jgi:hypothetical protein
MALFIRCHFCVVHLIFIDVGTDDITTAKALFSCGVFISWPNSRTRISGQYACTATFDCKRLHRSDRTTREGLIVLGKLLILGEEEPMNTDEILEHPASRGLGTAWPVPLVTPLCGVTGRSAPRDAA